MSLCRIEVITSLAKFSSLKSALSKAGVRGMTVMQVLGCGVEKGTREYEVDENYEMELLPKQQIKEKKKKEQVDKIVEVIKHGFHKMLKNIGIHLNIVTLDRFEQHMPPVLV